MNGSMINAMVAMNSSQQKLDLLADNIANVNTVGYKRKEASFQELLTTMTNQPEDFKQAGRFSPLGFSQGWGARLVNIKHDLSQGPLFQTNEPYDVAITGNALFEVMTDDAGGRGYTRNGAWQLTIDGNESYLTTKDGYPIMGKDGNRIDIPEEAQAVRVNEDGSIEGKSAAGWDIQIGQLQLVRVVNPAMLSQVADNLYKVAPGINAADVLQEATAAADSELSIRQGYVEQSNVSLTDEMTELINVQRAYQLSARALSSGDTMLGLANNLRG